MGAWFSINKNGANNHRWVRVTRACKECGSTMHVKPSTIKIGSGKFCSRKCNGVWQSKYRIGENSLGWKGDAKVRKCLFCGKKIVPSVPGTRLRPRKFCSSKCQGHWASEFLKGENAVNWQGGITPIHFAIRNSLKYRVWRGQIFGKDKSTCQKCGYKGRRINAHHIKKFSEIFREMMAKNPSVSDLYKALSWEDFWKISNGITLCIECHKKEHIKNGY
jgi:endogenous inhibitor of DNA gyrase (YacG/DUF329 family)